MPPTPPHGSDHPSAWVRRWAPALPPGGSVLDLACGHGRHVRHLAAQGLQVSAVDRDAAAIAALQGLPGVAEAIVADLEAGPWPLPGRHFDAVVITNYLWRPLWPQILDSLAPGGWLIHETFGVDQARIGKPSNPLFLLRPGELLEVCRGLRVVAYEDGFLRDPDRHVQRIAAVREPDPVAAGLSALPARHPL